MDSCCNLILHIIRFTVLGSAFICWIYAGYMNLNTKDEKDHDADIL